MSETDLSRSIRKRVRTKRTKYHLAFVCEICGSHETRIVSSPKITRRFCSPRCRNFHNNRTEKARASAALWAAELGKRSKTHGESHLERSAEYDAWRGMKRRCSPNNEKARPYYADRGITVCEKWASSFDAFLADVGRKPSPKHSLDRIDNDGNYEPGNVRWATWSQQMLNRRGHRIERKSA